MRAVHCRSRIRLAHIDRERPVYPGDDVQVDLGQVSDVRLVDLWRLRSLTIDANTVTLVGATSTVRAQVRQFLIDHPDVKAGEYR